MKEIQYDRDAAVRYARKWALSRNPQWYNFDGMGGDCTNFISQCLRAGRCVMNFDRDTGWYYRSLSDRAPAWTGVEPFGRFLASNRGPGPITEMTDLTGLEIGDVIQLCGSDRCYHSLIVTRLLFPAPEGIRICAHTTDSLDRPLSSYEYTSHRCFHISAVRLW